MDPFLASADSYDDRELCEATICPAEDFFAQTASRTGELAFGDCVAFCNTAQYIKLELDPATEEFISIQAGPGDVDVEDEVYINRLFFDGTLFPQLPDGSTAPDSYICICVKGCPNPVEYQNIPGLQTSDVLTPDDVECEDLNFQP